MPVQPLFFATADAGDPAGKAPAIRPWKRVPLDATHSGAWVVAGDLDGDGQVEIVSARNVNADDVHYTSAVVAQRLDGSVLWRWGNPAIGRRGLHHDVACQIHDWNGDGRPEVILCAEGSLVELDGASGEERRRIPLPPGATDCLVFANLSGKAYASDVLVKDRYAHLWALDRAGNLLWTVQKPGGHITAHQPFPVDIDGDGRDEIMAGSALLNADGSVRWLLPEAETLAGGHVDCCRVLRPGKKLQDWCLVLTTCAANRLLAVDGKGTLLWAVDGHHFESIDVGRVHPGRPGAQILVDLVDTNAVWLVDENGDCLGEIKAEYTRFHTLVDWNGDGLDEIVLPHARGLFDWHGQRIGTFAMEPPGDLFGGHSSTEGEIGNVVLHGNLTGGGAADIAITTPGEVCIFRNEAGAKHTPAAPLGTARNFTLY